jgi:hypothetical protein
MNMCLELNYWSFTKEKHCHYKKHLNHLNLPI